MEIHWGIAGLLTASHMFAIFFGYRWGFNNAKSYWRPYYMMGRREGRRNGG